MPEPTRPGGVRTMEAYRRHYFPRAVAEGRKRRATEFPSIAATVIPAVRRALAAADGRGTRCR